MSYHIIDRPRHPGRSVHNSPLVTVWSLRPWWLCKESKMLRARLCISSSSFSFYPSSNPSQSVSYHYFKPRQNSSGPTIKIRRLLLKARRVLLRRGGAVSSPMNSVILWFGFPSWGNRRHKYNRTWDQIRRLFSKDRQVTKIWAAMSNNRREWASPSLSSLIHQKLDLFTCRPNPLTSQAQHPFD